MLIQIDNEVREMTPEEEEMYSRIDDEATESDYIEALQDLGVNTNEEN